MNTTAAFSHSHRSNNLTATEDTILNGEKNQGYHISRMTEEPGIFTPNHNDASSLQPRGDFAMTPGIPSTGNKLNRRNQ